MDINKNLMIIISIMILFFLNGCLSNDNSIIEIENQKVSTLKKLTISVDPLNCGYINGNVKNFITDLPMGSVEVYASNQTDITFPVYTDVAGIYSFSVPADDTYEIHISKNDYQEVIKSSIFVAKDDTYEVGVSYLTPDTDEVYASMQGYVYCDDSKEIALSEAAVIVYTDQNQVSDFNVAITDQNGFYKLTFADSGNYKIYTINGNNINTVEVNQSVTQTQVDSMEIILVEDIILKNASPVITESNSNLNAEYPMTSSNKIFLSIDVTDLDGDFLEYQWTTTGGYLDLSDNNENYWYTDDAGTYEVIVNVSDKKNGNASKIWEIVVQ